MEQEQPGPAAPNPADAAQPKAEIAQPAAGTPTLAPEPTGSAVQTHCPYRRTTDLLQRLAPNKMRIGFFIGAGCSLSVQGADEKPLIPGIAGLTNQVKDHLDNGSKLKEVADTAWGRVVARGISSPTVEDVLSHLRTLRSLCGTGPIDGFSAVRVKSQSPQSVRRTRSDYNRRLPER